MLPPQGQTALMPSEAVAVTGGKQQPENPALGLTLPVAEAPAIPVGGSCDPGALSWQIIAAQEEMLRKERELEEARKKLAMIRQQQYKFLPSELRDEEQN